MKDQKKRDGRYLFAGLWRRLIDRPPRPVPVVAIPPGFQCWPFGRQCLYDSELASKRIDARAWLYAENRRRRDQ